MISKRKRKGGCDDVSGEEIRMINIHRIVCGNGNCYVLEENGSAVLVDTGRTEYRERLAAKIQSFPIKAIILTHGHFDHCQNADYFSRLFQAPIAMSAADADLVRNQMKEPLSAHTILGKVVLKASVASFKKVRMDFMPSVFLEDGACLEQYGIGAHIIALPGHTEGSVGIDCGAAGVLVGDALMNMFYPTVSMLYENWEKVQESARRIADLGDVLVYFGHGRAVWNRKWGGSEN